MLLVSGKVVCKRLNSCMCVYYALTGASTLSMPDLANLYTTHLTRREMRSSSSMRPFVLLSCITGQCWFIPNFFLLLLNIYDPNISILCFIPRTTMTSLSAHQDTWCILYASTPMILFECMRKHTSCARDNQRLRLEYTLTSQSFSRWDNISY